MGEARRRGTRDDRRRAPKGAAWRAVRGEPVVYGEATEVQVPNPKIAALLAARIAAAPMGYFRSGMKRMG